MAQELDLYGSPIDWRKALSIVTVTAVIVSAVGFFGYRWLTSVTPVTRAQALEMFEQESRAAEADGGSRVPTERGAGSDRSEPQAKNDAGRGPSTNQPSSSGSGGGGSSPKNDQTVAAAGTSSSEASAQKRPARASQGFPTTPAEGVYSWDTKGWEEAAGIRRDFPSESQRIITASNGSSWKQHHYFSEEREIWSDFVISERGAHMAKQRNRAKFGPVTNDSTIDFSPPMLVGLRSPAVGKSWGGKWQGRTSGSYTARIFDHGTMNIGGESLEVWGYELRLTMRGELDGTVFARVMYAPEHALTVQEHYTQDIQSERGRYRADWTVTLKSTTPQR